MAGKKYIVEQALKMIAGGVKKSRSDAPISAWHATEKPFASYDWSLLGSTTKPNVEGTSAENWAMDLARIGPWASGKKIDLGYGIHIPIAVGGKGKAFNSLDELQKAIARAGGPDKFRQNMTAKGFGHLKVADEEFGGTSYVSLTPETFTVRDDQIDRASGGSIREGYGPGGWVDDVVKMAGKVISGEGEDAAKAGIRAYHGSPHSFDRFDMSKIGTGEGAQAYGHGLYFAENEGVAKEYRDALAGSGKIIQNNKAFDTSKKIARIAKKYGDELASEVQGTLRMVATKQMTLDEARKYWMIQASRSEFGRDVYIAMFRDAQGLKNTGSMYEVNINADPDAFLDWDKPLSEQPEAVRKAVASVPQRVSDLAMDQKALMDLQLQTNLPSGISGGALHSLAQKATAHPAAVSAALKQAGIPGIKYLDAGSRGAGDGTRNYVVFDDKLISIIRKYGIAGASAMLGYNLMEQLDPKQALAASMADQDYQASRPQRSMGGNNSISGALNVARGMNGAR